MKDLIAQRQIQVTLMVFKALNDLVPDYLLTYLSHRGEFATTTFGKDEVLPRANGPIVSSGTVSSMFTECSTPPFVLGDSLVIEVQLSATVYPAVLGN